MLSLKDTFKTMKKGLANSLEEVVLVMIGVISAHQHPYDPKIHGSEDDYIEILHKKSIEIFGNVIDKTSLTLDELLDLVANDIFTFRNIVKELEKEQTV